MKYSAVGIQIKLCFIGRSIKQLGIIAPSVFVDIISDGYICKIRIQNVCPVELRIHPRVDHILGCFKSVCKVFAGGFILHGVFGENGKASLPVGPRMKNDWAASRLSGRRPPSGYQAPEARRARCALGIDKAYDTGSEQLYRILSGAVSSAKAAMEA